jgi:Zn-dependent peptidase ImmA (M78 family)
VTAAGRWDDPLVRRLAGRRDRAGTEALMESIADGWLAEAGQTALPIAIFALASAHGVRVRRSRAQPFAGRIYADGERLVIDVNGADPEERQRFTCAHELMHTAFPGFRRERRYRVDRDVDERLFARSRAEEERLCDIGAAALLMPRDLIASHARREPLEAIEAIARAAAVSLEAAANRLVRVREEPAVLLVVERLAAPGRRRRDLRLRVRYAVAPRTRTWVPRFADVRDDSAIARAVDSGRRERAEETLPGHAGGAWAIEAKAYARRSGVRVLAVATPLVPAGRGGTVGAR